MERVSMNLTVFICCVVLVACINTEDFSDETFRRESFTYVDFINEISTTVEHSDDQHHVESIINLNDEIYEMYSSVRTFLTKSRKTAATTDKASNSIDDKVINMAMSHNERGKWSVDVNGDNIEPSALRTIRDALQKHSDVNQNTTSTCIADIGRLITNLPSSKSWAFQFFDATGKPGPSLSQLHLNFVGNYEQCRSATAPPDQSENLPGFKGSYFHIVMYTNIPGAFLNPQLGVCLPDTCSSKEISILVQEMVIGKSIAKIRITYAYGEKLDAPKEMTTATIAAITILSVIGSMMVIGTIIDVVVVKSWNQEKEQSLSQFGGESISDKDTPNGYDQGFGDNASNGQQHEVNRNPPIVNDDTTPLIYCPRNSNANSYTVRTAGFKFNPSNVLVKMFLAFSVYTNGKKLLSTKQSAGSLGAVHGIRFFSMSWVVLCHWYGFSLPYMVNGVTEFPNMVKRWTFLPIMNGYSSVDSFFTLSGLLTAYLTTKEMKNRGTAKINWFMFYFHRFWRLTPPYMLALLTVLGFSQYLGQGPLWNNMQPGDKVSCEKNWWTNLLYINNIVNTDAPCFGHSWYLANDMQFFVLSPLMLVPLYFNKFLGLLSCLCVLLVHMITTGVLSSYHKWSVTNVSMKPVPGRASSAEWFNDYYLVPWCRIGPFVIGVIAGYLLALTKGRQFRMRWWVVVVGWVVAIASGLAVVYGLRGDIVGDNPSSVEVSALYNTVSRSVWGACVCWVVIACSAGYGGPINAFLSWSPFVFLGRLTYMVYLIHLSIGGTVYQNLGALLYFNDTTMVITFVGTFTCVNMIAFVAVLALESPMVALEKVLFKRDRGN